MNRAEALKLSCPKCCAPPRLPCMGKRGPRKAHHAERYSEKRDIGFRASGRSRTTRCNTIGWVYFIGHPNDDLVKIGWTGGAPEKRLAMLQTGNGRELFILACVRGTQRDEQAYHAQFAAIRTTGEWFMVNEELDALIRVNADWRQ